MISEQCTSKNEIKNVNAHRTNYSMQTPDERKKEIYRNEEERQRK